MSSVGKLFRKRLVFSIHSQLIARIYRPCCLRDICHVSPQQNLKNQWTCMQMQLNVKCMYSIWWNHVWCSLFSISKLHPNHYTPSLELPLHVPVANIFVVLYSNIDIGSRKNGQTSLNSCLGFGKSMLWYCRREYRYSISYTDSM